ncbi:MAG: extradiol ring-cleavage dioxygenase [bacterium]|nr:extradiol ring-cleavage dioxygenase [Deltaproteobacteria bacterium]MCP4908820.1 extradiol ring-cleavage dioxygenase [bacterium]
MGEVLGLGVTHFPPYSWPDENMADALSMILGAPGVEERFKNPAHWPASMREEWGEDQARGRVVEHRERMRLGFDHARAKLDAFAPDFVVIIGDDQYENFREDIIPPFCVFGLEDDFDLQPWKSGVGARRKNTWGEGPDFRYPLHGFRDGARAITRGLIEAGVDMPYAFGLHHEESLGHAFANTVLFLDSQRKGFDYPVVPFAVNAYGSAVLRSQGGLGHLLDPDSATAEQLADPPAPAPWRCMEVGAKLAKTLTESPWRVALIASSSWSHAFLSPRTGYVWPDVEADRIMIDALRNEDYDVWRNLELEDLEASGQHEILNWMLVVGAMEALGQKPVVDDFIETWVFNSTKVFVSWEP